MTNSTPTSTRELEDIIDAEVIEDVTFAPERTPRQQQIHELRGLLTLLEENPDLPLPNGFGTSHWNDVCWFAVDVVEAAKLVTAIGGPWGKNDPNLSNYNAENLIMTRTLDREIHVRVTVSRERVCEKTVVGTENKKVRKLVTEAVYEDVYEDVDVVDFKCGSLLSVAAQIELDKLEAGK